LAIRLADEESKRERTPLELYQLGDEGWKLGRGRLPPWPEKQRLGEDGAHSIEDAPGLGWVESKDRGLHPKFPEEGSSAS
jgi:hypothetical protein